MNYVSRIKMETFKPTHSIDEPILTKDETKLAVEALVKPLTDFPKINRRFVDPHEPGEPRFALFSFIEHQDVDMLNFIHEIEDCLTPELKVQYQELRQRPPSIKGVAKIRGVFLTQHEAEQRAEKIVREIDSTNSIFTCIVGAPFPLVPEGFAKEVSEIDVRKQEVENTISQNVRIQQNKAKKEIEEIKAREDELMKNAKRDPNADDLENYISHRVKLAHLRYSIEQHVEKHAECVEKEKNCVKFLIDMNSRNSEFEEKYMEKYKAGRKAAHIPDDHESEGFMKFMSDPLEKSLEKLHLRNERV